MTDKWYYKFLAVVLSIFLVLSLIVTTTLQMCNNAIRSENILNICLELLDEEDNDMFEGLEKKAVESLLESKAMEEIIDVFIDSLRGSFVTGKMKIDADDVTDIMLENKKEIIRAFKKTAPDDAVIEKFKDNYDNYAEEMGEEFARELSLETIKMPLLSVLFSKATMVICWIVTVLLAALIFLCRYTGFKGLLWLGINTLISAVPMTALRIVGGIVAAKEEGSDVAIDCIVANILNIVSLFAIITAIVGVLLIAAHVTVRIILKRKAERPAPEAIASPVE